MKREGEGERGVCENCMDSRLHESCHMCMSHMSYIYLSWHFDVFAMTHFMIDMCHDPFHDSYMLQSGEDP